jgi:hypothetical protein
MTRTIAAAALISIALAVCAIDARQTRDAGRPAATAATVPAGTSVLTGTIVTDEGKPVRRATVKLSGSDGPSARIAVTDDAGRFTFARLPAGSFTMSATKAGYVTTFYGSKRPGRGPAVPIALATGERRVAPMTMLRGAAVSGTITDPFGHPAPQVFVQVKTVSPAGVAAPVDAGAPPTATTDDRGAYRIYGLAPGDYIVMATPPIVSNASTGEALMVNDDEVRWAQQQLSQNARAGAAAGSSTPLPPAERAVTYSPVYFPGTTVADTAVKITLAPGEDRADVSFALQFVSTAKIDGAVVTPNGQPASGVLLLLLPKAPGSAPAFQAMFDAGLVGVPRVPVSPDGKFATAGVTPGQYTLCARSGVDVPVLAAGPGATTLWGELEVSVDGRDLSGGVVTLQPGVKVTGSIVFDGTSIARPADLSRVRVALSSMRIGSAALVGNLVATVGPSGAFVFPSLLSGPYTIKVTLPPAAAPGGARWTLKSVMVGGRDVADGTLELRTGEDVNGIVITFSDKETELLGTLLDAAGRPTPEFSIVVFSADRAFWTAGSRRVQSARPATNGTFRMAGLPAGEYFMAAVTDIEPGALSDPMYLEQLLGAAFKITLAEGEKKMQDLKIR